MESRKDPFQAIWLAIPVLLILISVWSATEFPRDFWLHANHGRQMWQTGQVVRADQFTHTINAQPVMNQPWLTQLMFFGLYEAGGYALVQFTIGLVYAIAIGCCAWIACQRCGQILPAAVLTVLTAIIMLSNLGVRPQAISVLLFAAELCVLWRVKNTVKMIALVAAIELLWANTHGAFPLGIVLPCIFFAGSVTEWLWGCWRVNLSSRSLELLRRRFGMARIVEPKNPPLTPPCKGGGRSRRSLEVGYLLAAVAAAVVMFATPQGTDIVAYVYGVSSRASERQVEEWLPTTLDTFAGRAFWASMIPAVLLVGLQWRKIRVTELLLLVAFGYLAAKCQRMVTWWALLLPAMLSPHAAQFMKLIDRTKENKNASSPMLNLSAIGGILVILAFSTPWTKQYNLLLPAEKRGSLSADEPIGATRFLAEHGIRGRLYQPMEWGSYFSWSLHPDIKVFADSRIDFFSDEVWNDYVQAGAIPERTEGILEKYGVNIVVCDHRRSRVLVSKMESLPNWQKVFVDHNSVVFLQNGALPAGA